MKGVPCTLAPHLLLTSPFCHVQGARSAQNEQFMLIAILAVVVMGGGR